MYAVYDGLAPVPTRHQARTSLVGSDAHIAPFPPPAPGIGHRSTDVLFMTTCARSDYLKDMMMKNYKDLVSWQKSMQLAVEVYKLTRLLPKEETYGLISQLRRAAVSVSSNIAEGYGRESTMEYVRFLKVARGSLYETETQLSLCEMLGLLTQADIVPALSLCSEIGRMLNTMIRRLQNR